MKYRTKPLEVEARQLGKGDDEAIMRWCNGVTTYSKIEGMLFHISVGKDVKFIAQPGNWIVKRGEALNILTEAQFGERYEAIMEKPVAEKPVVEKVVEKVMEKPVVPVVERG